MRFELHAFALLVTISVSNAEPVVAQTSQFSPTLSSAKTPNASVATSASWGRRLFSAVGGAALGAGVGFFASQIFTGDWDETPGRDQVDRPAWAAVGGSIGLVIGFSFPIPGRGATPAPAPARGLRGGRYLITIEEMRGTEVNTAYDAVRLLRPEWLVVRGVDTFGENTQDRIQVYLDDVRLGGVPALRDVGVHAVRSIYFLDAAAATFRWGAGHNHGAILIIAAGG